MPGSTGPDWAKAGRATAAHSTLTLGETSCLEFLDIDSFAGRWLGARALTPYPAVKIERVEDLAGVWLTASHDAYLRRFGVIHARRLFLSLDGGELAGEDLLSPPEGRKAQGPDGTEFAVRFHLHPDVEAALVGEVDGVRLLGERQRALACEEQVRGPDAVIVRETCFGLGYALQPGLAPGAGRRCFGHPGAGGSLAFADPDQDIGFAYVTNAMQFNPDGDPRSAGLVKAAYACLEEA